MAADSGKAGSLLDLVAPVSAPRDKAGCAVSSIPVSSPMLP
ncbi:hypothetical protein MGWOODY_Smn2931 [hydrothermal vent metagenome]|uniref:Uncharacterized protein n=1 Tax=hydrothermal vent metagenome TaxID=652676 RepID=A0A160TGJ7_9ZZZZ